MELLTWLEQTDFSTWLRESDWGYPSMLCVHAIGMGMVVGISLMYSARILGYARQFPLAGFDKLFALAWFGFAINAASGVLLFVGEPRRLFATPAFWIKMILIVFAGLSLWALAKALHGEADPYAADGPGRRIGRGGRGDDRRQDRSDLFDRVLARCNHCGPDHRLHHAAAAAVTARWRLLTPRLREGRGGGHRHRDVETPPYPPRSRGGKGESISRMGMR